MLVLRASRGWSLEPTTCRPSSTRPGNEDACPLWTKIETKFITFISETFYLISVMGKIMFKLL